MKTTAEKIAVMQAYEDGKTIEITPRRENEWALTKEPLWNWGTHDYRAKKEPHEVWLLRDIHSGHIDPGHYATPLHAQDVALRYLDKGFEVVKFREVIE